MSGRHLRVVDTETGEVKDDAPPCPRCADAQAECEVWEQEVLKLKRHVKRLEEDKDAKNRNDKDYPAACALFEEWQEVCGHPDARFDQNRIRLALTAIRRYREDREKLSWVIKYGRYLAFVNDRGVKQDQFGLLFRDAEHIERYARGWFIAQKQARR